MKGLIDSIRSLGMVRVAILMAVTIGVMGALVLLQIQGAPMSRMGVLMADLDSQTMRPVLEMLEKARIVYRVEGSNVLVGDTDMANARASLAREGLGSIGTMGYEIFDRGGDLAMTDFDQQVKLTRALEGELSRTIMAVRGIVRARVHLVLPHRQPFQREKAEAQASVMLTLAGRGALSSEAIQSVVNLVAAGVPGLRPQNVTLVDSNLHLLYSAAGANDAMTRASHSEDVRQKTEARLAQAVELMLERSLGVGHVHAEASIRMNFDRVNETSERFDPDSSAIRSTQNVTSNNKTTEKSGAVSVANNLPNADAGSGSGSGSQEAKQEETTNYELTKTVRAIVRDQPQVERITVAVMVDGTEEVGADGKRTWKPRGQEELDRIEKLVKSAIGFDEKRGDVINIVSMPFASTVETPETPVAIRPALQNSELMSFVQVVAFGVIGLAIIVLTARSIYRTLSKPPASIAVADDGTVLSAGPGSAGALGGGPGVGGRPQLVAPDGSRPMLADDTAGALDNTGPPPKPSSIAKVAALVESNPAEVLSIMRSWMAQDSSS
jgi:flagellar M-ring protein FliF